jgi:hypothetical protein
MGLSSVVRPQGHHHEIRKCSAFGRPQSPKRKSCDPETQEKVFPADSKRARIYELEDEWRDYEPKPQSQIYPYQMFQREHLSKLISAKMIPLPAWLELLRRFSLPFPSNRYRGNRRATGMVCGKHILEARISFFQKRRASILCL